MKTIISRDMECVQDNVILFLSSLYEEVQSGSKLRNNGNNGIEQLLLQRFIVLIYGSTSHVPDTAKKFDLKQYCVDV